MTKPDVSTLIALVMCGAALAMPSPTPVERTIDKVVIVLTVVVVLLWVREFRRSARGSA